MPIALDNEIKKQKKCPECGGIAFTIWKVVPPPFKFEFKCDITGEDRKYEKKYRGHPRFSCVSCGEHHNKESLKFIEVEEIVAMPEDIDFISFELRYNIDMLLWYAESGIEIESDIIQKIKKLLPLPFEGYNPIYGSE